MDKLNKTQYEVMAYYAEQVHEGWVMPFNPIAEGIQKTRQATKRAVRQLARAGYLEYSVGFNEDDGLIAGGGYMLTGKGQSWCKEYWASLTWKQEVEREAAKNGEAREGA